MKKKYESPRCESIRLFTEAPILSGSTYTGRKLQTYDDDDFNDEANWAKNTWFD